MNRAIKICGIRTAEAFDCAVSAGATHIGFNFVPGSPRLVTLDEAAAIAARKGAVTTVALTANATDEDLAAIATALKPGMWQLHGSETPERVHDVKSRFGLPVMKAISVSGADSVAAAHAFESTADWLLFDATSGGSGLPFDWTLLSLETWSKPWMLAGGLTPDTVASAIYQTRPPGVDVSSGVEKTRGNKDCNLIASFISRAKSAFSDIALGHIPSQS